MEEDYHNWVHIWNMVFILIQLVSWLSFVLIRASNQVTPRPYESGTPCYRCPGTCDGNNLCGETVREYVPSGCDLLVLVKWGISKTYGVIYTNIKIRISYYILVNFESHIPYANESIWKFQDTSGLAGNTSTDVKGVWTIIKRKLKIAFFIIFWEMKEYTDRTEIISDKCWKVET